MGKLIPNERTKVVFCTTISNKNAPTVAEITAGVPLTGFLTTLDANARGNTVPTPSFDSLFETSIPGTNTATFSAEFYRDDTADTAWDTLPRMTSGFFVVARFGWNQAGGGTGQTPVAGDEVEVWPTRITSRAPVALANNDAQRFNVDASVSEVPAESASVAA